MRLYELGLHLTIQLAMHLQTRMAHLLYFSAAQRCIVRKTRDITMIMTAIVIQANNVVIRASQAAIFFAAELARLIWHLCTRFLIYVCVMPYLLVLVL